MLELCVASSAGRAGDVMSMCLPFRVDTTGAGCAARNSSVHTASLWCFSIILEGCHAVCRSGYWKSNRPGFGTFFTLC